MQSTLYSQSTLSLNKALCVPPVCSGGVCAYEFIALLLWNLVRSAATPKKTSLSPLLSHGTELR